MNGSWDLCKRRRARGRPLRPGSNKVDGLRFPFRGESVNPPGDYALAEWIISCSLSCSLCSLEEAMSGIAFPAWLENPLIMLLRTLTLVSKKPDSHNQKCMRVKWRFQFFFIADAGARE